MPEEQLLCVDRLEGSLAVCEDGRGHQQKIPVETLPDGVKEGDCLRVDAHGGMTIDIDETQRRRERLKKLQQQLLSDTYYN